ncbi:hypothetical protein FORC47_p236 (plasmid) [Bacillus cereus]|nr:hypothetical protein FORC47_p236 [Bacillus cereus]
MIFKRAPFLFLAIGIIVPAVAIMNAITIIQSYRNSSLSYLIKKL